MQLDPPVTPKSLPKLETQGKFTLSCSLGKFTLDDALVDFGASVNVISMEMVKTLGIENMEPNTSLLMFGDSSSTTPIGLIKDFPLKIGACTIPIDLTVLKMATVKRVLLILGTPFLTIVGACIDFANKKVTLLNVNKVVSYPIKSLMMNVEYWGTITCGGPSIEKIKDEVEKKVLMESLLKRCVMSTWKVLQRRR
uniref:Aspartic peptidase DDI1-type domain-containing protein n=1 Tax=Brassica oleracea var. oleracea TaxID=109376 RepID=A0A0D3CWX3_BRAOL